MESVYTKALQRAAEIAGGKHSLRAYLRVPTRALEAWMQGKEKPPMDVFLKAVDLISDPAALEAAEKPRVPRAQPVDPRDPALERNDRARRIQASVLARNRPVAVKARSAFEFLAANFEPDQGAEQVEETLDVAIATTGADMGNVQLRTPEGLRIVAHRGFQPPFLEFFACVSGGETSCGVALLECRQVVIGDVATDALYAGMAARGVLLDAGVRAAQSTPLTGESGDILGVLSTHYRHKHEPSERELEIVDQIARRAAFWLDGGLA
jgi:hypothetical protein